MAREQLFAGFFFAVLLLLLYQLFLFLAPFASPLFWAAILSLTFYPVTPWLVWLCRGSRFVASVVLVVSLTLLVIIPSVFLGTMLVRETAEAYQRVQEMAETGELTTLIDRARTSRPGRIVQNVTAPFEGRVDIDPAALALAATQWLSQLIASQSAELARNVLGTFVNFTLMLVALFFFFRDGARMSARVAELIPMAPSHKDTIMRRLYDTLTAVVQSMVLTAVAQGTLAGLGYWLIGNLRFSVFLGFLTGVASFVPMAGATLVWASTAIYLAMSGSLVRAALVALWGLAVVSTVDNLIKPLFIGGRAKLPTFLLLFAILGGLLQYGFIGVFLGPVLLALLLSFVDIYRELYHQPVSEPPSTPETT